MNEETLNLLVQMEWNCPNCKGKLKSTAWIIYWKVCQSVSCDYMIDIRKTEIINNKSDLNLEAMLTLSYDRKKNLERGKRSCP